MLLVLCPTARAPLGAGAEEAASCSNPADAVVITCHGRSGSTLTERMFDLNKAAYTFYEPLRPWDLAHCYSHHLRDKALASTAVAVLSCNLSHRVPIQCPWHRWLAPRALSALTPELIESELAMNARKRSEQIEYRKWAAQLRQMVETAPDCRRALGACGSAVAVKVVRLSGLLDVLYAEWRRDQAARRAAAAQRGTRRRIVFVHVVRVRAGARLAWQRQRRMGLRAPRDATGAHALSGATRRARVRARAPPPVTLARAAQDPRALLHSRIKVGWGMPKTRRPPAVQRWAKKICSLTLLDMQTGQSLNTNASLPAGAVAAGRRDVYVRVRYEDLVTDPIGQAERVYGVLGKPVPAEVSEFFRAEVLRSQRPGRSLKWVEGAYATGHERLKRSPMEIMRAWRSELSPELATAVERGCRQLMRVLDYEPLSPLPQSRARSMAMQTVS